MFSPSLLHGCFRHLPIRIRLQRLKVRVVVQETAIPFSLRLPSAAIS